MTRTTRLRAVLVLGVSALALSGCIDTGALDWDLRQGGGDTSDAARQATAAAPTFFEALPNEGYVMIDGGLWANNPVMNALVDIASATLGRDLRQSTRVPEHLGLANLSITQMIDAVA